MNVHIDPDDRPLALEDNEVIQPGEAMVYPLWWTETATSNLQIRCKEITNDVEQVIAGLSRDQFLEA
eukprot:3842271-Alexandrium_andersonii.AAC.1